MAPSRGRCLDFSKCLTLAGTVTVTHWGLAQAAYVAFAYGDRLLTSTAKSEHRHPVGIWLYFRFPLSSATSRTYSPTSLSTCPETHPHEVRHHHCRRAQQHLGRNVHWFVSISKCVPSTGDNSTSGVPLDGEGILDVLVHSQTARRRFELMRRLPEEAGRRFRRRRDRRLRILPLFAARTVSHSDTTQSLEEVNRRQIPIGRRDGATADGTASSPPGPHSASSQSMPPSTMCSTCDAI